MAYSSGIRHGIIYTPGQKLGSGGEGIVYEIIGSSDWVLKIYHPDHFKTDAERSTMERKLRAMLNMNVAAVVENKLRLAWPTDIVYKNGKMVGFVMPKVTAPLKIFDLYRPIVPKTPLTKKRDTAYPNYQWKYSVQYAYNLSWVVNYVHSKGIVIGDLNDNNILADPQTGAVILIDCDSFDIRDPATNEHFRCVCARPEMLAPELQNVGVLASANFTRESDNFSLAIHIFRLLMNGEDPFGGQVTTGGSQSAIPANAAIVNGECAYVRAVPGKTLLPRMLPLSFLPVSLQALFLRTFDYTAVTARARIGNRTRASEWMNALLPVGLKNPTPPLITCPKDLSHVYPAHNGSCPWCKVLAATNQPLRTTSTSSYTPTRTTSISSNNRSNTIAQSYTSGQNGQKQPAGGQTNSGCGWFGILLLLAALTAALYFFRDEIRPIVEPVITSATEFVQEVMGGNTSEEYILPNSATRYLTEDDLAGLTDEELTLAKNELFARHGRKFKTEWIRNYFLETSWYEEIYDPDVFDENVHSFFNEYEWANLQLIRECLEANGS